jgi:hypothetical protein
MHSMETTSAVLPNKDSLSYSTTFPLELTLLDAFSDTNDRWWIPFHLRRSPSLLDSDCHLLLTLNMPLPGISEICAVYRCGSLTLSCLGYHVVSMNPSFCERLLSYENRHSDKVRFHNQNKDHHVRIPWWLRRLIDHSKSCIVIALLVDHLVMPLETILFWYDLSLLKEWLT